jgi:hypothetical protein
VTINLLDIKLKEETFALMNIYGDKIERISEQAAKTEVEGADQDLD